MAEIALLEPTVLRGVLEKLPVASQLTLLNKVPRTPWAFPSVTWDIVKGSRSIAAPNVPNSEAHIVGKLGRTQAAAAFVYLREKKVFEPTTIHWLKTPGTLAQTNAEQAVVREIQDLNDRFDSFAEFLLWGSLSGQLNATYGDVQINVDYQFDPTHKVTLATPWTNATPQDIVAQINLWKRMISLDGKVPVTDAYISFDIAAAILEAFATTPAMLSDRMKDQYFSTGQITGFMGINWQVVESKYEDASGNFVDFFGNRLVMGNFTANRPIELFEGPTADDDAPDGYTGKFTKSWKEPDPSARQILLEWNLLPVITRVEQFITVAGVV